MGSLALVACSGSTEPVAVPPVLRIGPDTALLLDEMMTPAVTARDERGAMVPASSIGWTSSDPAVASVDATGRVTAKALGSAVITATMDTVIAHESIIVAPQFLRIATGETHACGITGRGELFCWGMSQRGAIAAAPALQDCAAQFGTGITCSTTPVRSTNLRPADITVGAMHSCSLEGDGTAYCWGANFYGQVGTGSSLDAPTPTPVAGGHKFLQLVAGRMHTCGITTSHDAYCWGWDHAGQLGTGDVSSERCEFFGDDPCSRTPRLVVGGHQWVQLDATDRATCGITTSEEVYCWGLDVGGSDGLYCQMADNLAGCTRTPILESGTRSFRVTHIGDVHRCEQSNGGEVECWGANYFGAFGNGTTSYSATPVPAAGGAAYSTFVSGRSSACGLSSDGRAQCWGRGVEGQVGNGSAANALSPVDVSGGYRFSALVSSANSDFVCGFTTAGRAYCWGWGVYGQLGNGDFAISTVPALVRLVQP